MKRPSSLTWVNAVTHQQERRKHTFLAAQVSDTKLATLQEERRVESAC
jgi:hypothetical protein